MKKLVILIAVACSLGLLLASVASAAAATREEALSAAQERLARLFDSEDTRELFALFDKMKNVGLSWNEDLLIPLKNLLGCKSLEQLHVLWGVGAINHSYAMLFDKGDENFLEAGREIDRRIGFPRAKLREESKAFAEKREGQAASSIDMVLAMLELAKTDDAVLNTLVGGFYGSTIEIFYLLSSLGLASGVTDEFVAFVNGHLPQLELAREMLEAYSGNEELAKMLDADGRKAVIDSIVAIISGEMGKLTEGDLKEILSIVKSVRDPLVAPCQ